MQKAVDVMEVVEEEQMEERRRRGRAIKWRKREKREEEGPGGMWEEGRWKRPIQSLPDPSGVSEAQTDRHID